MAQLQTERRARPRTIDVKEIRPLTRAEKIQLAQTEYRRLSELLHSFSADDWSKPTECAGWSVRDIAGHLLGAIEADASMRENVRQLVRGIRRARTEHLSLIDGMNAAQIEERSRLGARQLCDVVEERWPQALRARFRFNPLRPLPLPAELPGIKEMLRLGFLLDIVYTRDAWIHRVDMTRATGKPMNLTARHDGRIVSDVVAEWARRHGRPFELVLEGPAGGEFRSGGGGESLRLDAVDFMRMLSRRVSGDGLLRQAAVF